MVDVLLQRCLVQELEKVGVRTQQANLILDHSVADIVNKAAELIRVLGVFEKTFDLALLCQRLEFLGDLCQFPKWPCLSGSIHDTGDYGPTFPEYSSWILLRYRPRKRVRRVIRQAL